MFFTTILVDEAKAKKKPAYLIIRKSAYNVTEKTSLKKNNIKNHFIIFNSEFLTCISDRSSALSPAVASLFLTDPFRS